MPLQCWIAPSNFLYSKRLARWLKSTWSSPMMRRLAVVILWPLRDYMKSKEGVCRWQRVRFLSRKDTNSYLFYFTNCWRQPGTLLASAPKLPAQVLSYCGGGRKGVTPGTAAFDPHPLVLPWPKSPKSISHSEGESGSKSSSEGLAFVWKDLLLSERLFVSSALIGNFRLWWRSCTLPRLQHCNVRIDCQCCEVDSGVCRWCFAFAWDLTRGWDMAR